MPLIFGTAHSSLTIGEYLPQVVGFGFAGALRFLQRKAGRSVSLKAFVAICGARTAMVSVTAFLTITNIALGYGLAIYIHRHYGTLTLTRKKSIQTESSSMIGTEEIVHDAGQLPASDEPVPVFETGAVQAETSAGVVETDPADAVDEENVLAGIEEFRSQLAKMSDPKAGATEGSESELVGAAN